MDVFCWGSIEDRTCAIGFPAWRILARLLLQPCRCGRKRLMLASPRHTHHSALLPAVDDFQTSQDSDGRNVTYFRVSVIDTSCSDSAAGPRRCSECFRRFNQFLMLHDRMRAEVAEMARGGTGVDSDEGGPGAAAAGGGGRRRPNLPSPPKKHLGRHDDAYLRQRQSELQTYLRGVQAAVPESSTFWSFVGIQLAGPPSYASPSTSPSSPAPHRAANAAESEANASTVSPVGKPAAAAAATSDIDGRRGHVAGRGEAGMNVAMRTDAHAGFQPGLTSIETFDWSYRSSANLLKRVIRRSGMLCGGGNSRSDHLSD